MNKRIVQGAVFTATISVAMWGQCVPSAAKRLAAGKPVVSQGLLNRREAEYQMFSGGGGP